MKTLAPETPLEGEWDQAPGKEFSEGNDHPEAEGDESPEVAAARAEALNDALRPLDRFMTPLADFLQLKTSVDVEPTSAEDKALLLIDQGKNAADPFLRRMLLVQAAQQLDLAAREEHQTSANETDPLDLDSTRGPDYSGTGDGIGASAHDQPEGSVSEESRSQELEEAAAVFSMPDADGSKDGDAPTAPTPSSKRRARLWFELLEAAWTQAQGGKRSHATGNAGGQNSTQPTARKGGTLSRSSSYDDGGGSGRDVSLARKAAVAILQSGPWSPERNRELVVLQTRAQFALGETYVEELRFADLDGDGFKGIGSGTGPGTGSGGDSANVDGGGGDAIATPASVVSGGDGTGRQNKLPEGLDPRTMGISTTSCQAGVSTFVADSQDALKKRACGCFVAGLRRGLRGQEPALVESGAVYVYNFHLPVWRRRLHGFATSDLEAGLEACVAALEALDCPDTALLCSIYDALARTMAASKTSNSPPTKVEDFCSRAIVALDRPPGTNAALATGGAGGAAKGGGGAKGKGGGGKKGEVPDKGSAVKGAAGARRANLSELKGLVEVRATCQASRAGAGAVVGEGRPLLQALALLTAGASVSGPPADELIEKCAVVMREYRKTIVVTTEAARVAALEANVVATTQGGEAMVPAPMHGSVGEAELGDKVDVFATLSARTGTTLEEDRAELELVGEIWCRLGKERLKRRMMREAEECCGYVTELLPKETGDRRRVHARLWRWLAVAEGLWGQVVAAMVAPESQEKPLQDELRKASLRHLVLAAKCATFASSNQITLDVAKRLWNVSLPLADTAAGRAMVFSPLRGVLQEMSKGGVVEGGSVRSQLYVLLFECYSDRSEWKQGLAAVTEALACVPPDFQRPLWQWRVVFMSRQGITALDGLAKTKESDKVLQGKSWCTLARSASDPKQQFSAYLKALESLGDRFERVDCLVEMGEWATGKGMTVIGSDYLRSAVDLLYDVEEKTVLALEDDDNTDPGRPPSVLSQGPTATGCSGAGLDRGASAGGGLGRSGSKRSAQGSLGKGGSRGSSRGLRSQAPSSTAAEIDENGFPETLNMGHLESVVRILAMLARGGCSLFEERLQFLLQAYYFVGRIAGMVTETVWWGHRYRVYQEAAPGGGDRGNMSFEDWCNTPGNEVAAPVTKMQLRDWAYWRPEAEHGDDLYRWMASPPPGREPFVLAPASISKAPLLFHHLLDLAEAMESHGLAAHAAAPLALSELVARLCLGPPRPIPPHNPPHTANSDEGGTPKTADSKEKGGGQGKGGASGKAKGKAAGNEKGEDEVVAEADGERGSNAEVFPALVLACLRRSRLLLKLGPTCHQAALQAVSAAGILGVSNEEAARRGAEVDRIMRQRKENASQSRRRLQPSPSSTPTVGFTADSGTGGGGGASGGGGAAGSLGVAVEIVKLEDREMWALLAKEAVLLGNCGAAAEYLAAAQRHNDAFHDRDNIIRCLETQAALCEAKGHPEQALPCLLRASGLVKAPGGAEASAARWGELTVSVSGAMRKAGMGDAKLRQALKGAYDALEGSIYRQLGGVEGGAMDPERSNPVQDVVDLDAAVAFARCAVLRADASVSVQENSTPPSEPLPVGTRGQAAVLKGTISTAVNATSRGCTTAPNNKNAQHASGGVAIPLTAVDLLDTAACRLRALGPHPALPAVLRQMAKEWVRKWAVSNTTPTRTSTPPPESSRIDGPRDGERTVANDHSEEGLAQNADNLACLRKAAECLAEARNVLLTIVASAEPVGDLVSSIPEHSQTKEEAAADNGAEIEEAGNGKKTAGKKGKAAETTQPPGNGGGGSINTADASSSAESCADKLSLGPTAAISTPVGRVLIVVQLEEACVRVMMGRLCDEARSETQAVIAAANQEGVTPIQRYLKASKPVKHPTAADMELPQLEQALLLAEMARERSELSVVKATEGDTKGGAQTDAAGKVGVEVTGLLPLALAWEGSALALLATRAGLSDGAWAPRPPPPPCSTPPPRAEPVVTKGGKGGAKGGKGAAGAKGGKTAAAEGDDETGQEKPPPSALLVEEGGDLRDQAKWKLERATEAAIAAKRWDAAGVASFALAEVVGGDDAVVAAGALMFHQSCRARGRLLRWLRSSLGRSSRYRLSLDRITGAQGLLRGLHNLDTCDPFIAPSPSEAGLSVEGQAGEGGVSSVDGFPPAGDSVRFMEAHLEGWRRLECSEPPGLALAGLPQGLAVLSLQISPDGTTLYAAGYAPVFPPVADTSPPGAAADDCQQIPPAVVWRYEMKASERRAMAALALRMEAFQGSVKRHCLERGDEEGKTCDLIPVQQPSLDTSSSSTGAGVDSAVAVTPVATVLTTPVLAANTPNVACEAELEGICAGTEAILAPVWAEHVDGGLAPFLGRCRAEGLALVLLLDECLEKLPVEACSALDGVKEVARDLSLHMLRHRVKEAAASGQEVSNSSMRYVADPLSEDPGIAPPARDPPSAPSVAAANAKKKKAPVGTSLAVEIGDGEAEGGRVSILKTLRECVGKGGGGDGGGGKGKGAAAANVNVSAWKGLGGDDHVAGVREWQSLICGEPAGVGGGGFVYYGPGRCLSKLAPEHLAGLSANCKAAIIIDRADNNESRRLESKQDTLKSQEELDAEGPTQTAAFFSMAGKTTHAACAACAAWAEDTDPGNRRMLRKRCQSVVLNMWSVTLHNNRRVITSLFRRWGEEGLSLGGAVAAVRGDATVKPRARFCTVLYGLPTPTYGK